MHNFNGIVSESYLVKKIKINTLSVNTFSDEIVTKNFVNVKVQIMQSIDF